jgi:hypothetical protein
MMIENTFGNDSSNLRKHFQKLKEEFNKKSLSWGKIGWNRFQDLRSAMNPTINEIRALTDILVKNSISLIGEVHLIVVDEAVIGTHYNVCI